MSGTDLSWYLREIRDEARFLWEFHRKEILRFAGYNVGIILSVIWITDMWNRGWAGGITWHVINWILDGFPESGPDPLVVPFFLVGGLILVFPFDQYKRLQGTILVVGSATLVLMLSYFDRVNIVWNEPTIALAGVMTVVGFLAGRRLGETDSRGLESYDKAFSALWYIVLIICVYGFIEAHTAYVTPFHRRAGWLGIQPASFAFKSTLPFTNEPTTAPVAALITIADLVFIAILLYMLKKFTEYELNQDVIIIGPDRAGKTWLMGGAGYSLVQESVNSSSTLDPVPDDDRNELGEVVDAFDNRNFDHPLLGPTDGLQQFKLRFNYGLIAKREVTVRCFDYPGERIIDATFMGEEKAREQYLSYFDTDDYDNLQMDELDMDVTGANKKDKIGALISTAVAKADKVGMVVPMDDFITGFTSDDLPSYLSPSDLDTNRNTKRSQYLRQYKRVIQNYGNDKDTFFIPTKSDALLEKFNGNPRTRADWPGFRRLVWQYVSLQNSSATFHPGTPLDMSGYYPETSKPGPVYPVYLQGPPDPADAHTPNGNLRPKLDWNDQRYPLRGLRELLKALGR